MTLDDRVLRSNYKDALRPLRFIIGAILVKYWSMLPNNTRRGLLRLYFGISVPWSLWFLYKLSYDNDHYHSKLSSDFFALISVPLGAILLFFITEWIVDGFHNRSPAIAKASNAKSAQSNHGGRVSEPTGRPPEVQAIFEKLTFLFQNESAQTERLPELIRSKILAGASCDEVAGGNGEFGRHLRNPVPINGPLGEMIYLSNLRVTDSGIPIMFHRLGSIQGVDVFETVSFDGTVWDFLFLDLYHPRKSHRSPAGYRIATGEDQRSMLHGTNELVADFPSQLMDSISRTYDRFIGLKMRPGELRKAIESSSFVRPPDHSSRYEFLLARCAPRQKENSTIDFVGVGRVLGRMLLEPEECWKDVCKLRAYAVPNSVATCEMAFARAAVVKDAVDQVYSDNARAELKVGVDKFVQESFTKEEANEETLSHYDGVPLAVVAAQAVQFYAENAFPLPHLADVFARRLSVTGVPSIEIAPLFEEVAGETVRILKYSQSARKTVDLLDNINSPGF